ncbi:MAG TPA: sec-independent translocase [Streptosporangiaceae bacterium]|jgi:sec-independent protein translocase protein TatB
MVHSQLERSLFDLSFVKIAVLAVIALVVFGPDQLPKMASQAGRALRELRRMAEGARADLQEHLGPEFTDFDLNELNPKYFVRKHLLDEADGSATAGATTGGSAGWAGIGTRPAGEPPVGLLEPGESPPYDAEAT